MILTIIFNKIKNVTSLENFEGICPVVGDTLFIDSMEYQVKHRIFSINKDINDTMWCQSITLILGE